MNALQTWNRRRFARAAAAIGLAGAVPAINAAEPPPETKRIRLVRYPSFDVACLSPLWIAEELLHAEGFDEVSYVALTAPIDIDTLSSGKADMTQTAIFDLLPALDEGKPVLALGGVHAGCFELFGVAGLRAVRDLRGKTIAVANAGRRGFVSAMLAHVGLDPRKDVKFVESWDGVRLLEEGKVDATLGFPPEPQVMRARKIGAAIVNTATDRPWSQYFCCMAIGNRDFVAKHPIATKRALRAIVKAGEICAAEPERVARTLVDRGFYKDHAGALQTLRDIPYRRWRESDSADSLRFYALRLHEAGLVKSNPHKLLAQGTDWRFIEQIKRELKA
jgi:NitT/TauT family transport system substrate-binding protein